MFVSSILLGERPRVGLFLFYCSNVDKVKLDIFILIRGKIKVDK